LDQDNLLWPTINHLKNLFCSKKAFSSLSPYQRTACHGHVEKPDHRDQCCHAEIAQIDTCSGGGTNAHIQKKTPTGGNDAGRSYQPSTAESPAVSVNSIT
jgi:hypothetical protein